MVSNYNRILDEIRKESHQIAGAYGLEPQTAVDLIMDIVDLEDRNRVKAVAAIKQQVKGLIENAAQTKGSREDL